MSYSAIIVDDERKLREVLKIKLTQFCTDLHIVGAAENAKDAFEMIKIKKPDLVFLDISMPGESGFELLNRFDNIDFE